MTAGAVARPFTCITALDIAGGNASAVICYELMPLSRPFDGRGPLTGRSFELLDTGVNRRFCEIQSSSFRPIAEIFFAAAGCLAFTGLRSRSAEPKQAFNLVSGAHTHVDPAALRSR